jgi:hypothetical protein
MSDREQRRKWRAVMMKDVLMRKPEFVYDASIPHDVLASVKRICKRFEWILPAWVEGVYVKFRTDGERAGNIAETATTKAYRVSVVWLGPLFVSDIEDGRRAHIVHEFLHIPTAPTVDKANHVIRENITCEKHRKLALDTIAELYEGAICDLARSIVEFDGRMRGRE